MTERRAPRAAGFPIPGITATEMVALALTVLWLALVGGFFLFARPAAPDTPAGAPSVVLTIVAIFLPIALIWVAAVTARTAREMRAEAARLKAAVDAMRAAYVSQQQAGAKPSVEQKLDEIAAAQRSTETALSNFATQREFATGATPPDRKPALTPPPRPAPSQPDDQPALALGTVPDESFHAPVSVADFITALNFPDSPEDREGFRALRAALEDRQMAKLIRAAQDVLNLLAQDGIYMDDLRPDRPAPELWRRFAAGERGKPIAPLGGVRDRSSLALTAARMRNDDIFRDAGHHFLRQFDRTFAEFEKNASDPEVARFAETRTARAFMLLGRVTGTFD